MLYNEFIDSVVNQLQVQLGDSYELALRPIEKNNGVILSGLTIGKGKEDEVKPTIYLEPYYEQYLKEHSVEQIVSDIVNLYKGTEVPEHILNAETLNEFDQIKDRIMFRIINTDANEVLLRDLPHVPYLDLSVVFFLALERSEEGQLTALIRNTHMQKWGVSLLDLQKAAYANTPREYPAQIKSMSDVLHEIFENMGEAYSPEMIDELLGSDDAAPLYVLSNTNGLYGASCMIYRDVLKDFADRVQADLILLPSSVHEVLLTPNLEDSSYEDLSSMVTSINRQEVSPEEQLSNQVYLFSRKDGSLKVVSNAPELVGASALS